MNNQERLKDIKDEFNDDLKLGYTPAEWYEEEMKWLLQQAERVDELAKENGELFQLTKMQDEEINRLSEYNRKLCLWIGRGIT